jgi:hypothetical protein
VVQVLLRTLRIVSLDETGTGGEVEVPADVRGRLASVHGTFHDALFLSRCHGMKVPVSARHRQISQIKVTALASELRACGSR